MTSPTLFSSRIDVRFGDVDAAGIVYYPRFFHYYHTVLEDFLAARGIPLARLIGRFGIGLPVSKLEATFRHPLKLGEVCQAELSVQEVGAARLTLHYCLYNPEGILAAEAIITSACTDLASHTPTFFPEEVRACLEAEMKQRDVP